MLKGFFCFLAGSLFLVMGATAAWMEEGGSSATKFEPTRMESKVGKTYADKTKINVMWKDGIHLTTNDDIIRLKLGGCIMSDWAFFVSADDDLSNWIESGTNANEIRLTRLYLTGSIYKRGIYKFQYKYSRDQVAFEDMYLGLKDIPLLGRLRIGQFKEPFGLEELTLISNITFMERALTSAFTPGYNAGICLDNRFFHGRINWAIGVFQKNSSDWNWSGRKSNFTTRLTFLPYFSHTNRTVLHLGGGYSVRNPESDTAVFGEKPESHLAPYLVGLNIPADKITLTGLELVFLRGSFSLQGEYVLASVEEIWNDDPVFSAGYIQASYFLTGENRKYTSIATLGQVKANPASGNSVDDALEIAVRYSTIALDKENIGIFGGELNDITCGFNWYLNPYVRMMGNYIFASGDPAGNGSIFQTRIQMNF
ncbi:hypothetical protein KAR10_06965 [bacterium]|nr:hypothetical protein [bacterium]